MSGHSPLRRASQLWRWAAAISHCSARRGGLPQLLRVRRALADATRSPRAAARADDRRRCAIHRDRRGTRPDISGLVRCRGQCDQQGRRRARARTSRASRWTPAVTRPTRCRRCARCMRRRRTSRSSSAARQTRRPQSCRSSPQNKTVSFCMTGQSEFDHVKFPYFYRLVPPDLSESYAMVAIAQEPPLQADRAGVRQRHRLADVRPAGDRRRSRRPAMKLVANETLDLSATTFRTEADAVIAAKPQVILTEALGPSEATFLSEVKQLNGGKLIPVIGTSATISPAWFKSVSAQSDASNARVELRGRQPRNRDERPGVQGLLQGDLRREGQGRQHWRLLDLSHSARVRSTCTTGSTSRRWRWSSRTAPTAAVYKADIIKIGDGVPGAKVVNSFAQGVAALKAGKQIRYEGPGRPDAASTPTTTRPGSSRSTHYTAQGQQSRSCGNLSDSRD